MKKILITGATGNVGMEVVKHLYDVDGAYEIILAVRDMERARKDFAAFPKLAYSHFDFKEKGTFEAAFKGIDRLFLLRPPNISEVDGYFVPLLQSAKKQGVAKVVFLSVQGAELSKMIPHNKIEHLIASLGFSYVFVRPSYFMQNLTTALLPEIAECKRITLPSGQAKFNWVDVQNIGEAIAVLLTAFEQHENKIYEITGTENKSFGEVTALMTEVTGTTFRFKSVNPFWFYVKKRKSGYSGGFAMVMTILHFLPRFQQAPNISDDYRYITGNRTTTLKEFITREKRVFGV